MVTEQFVVGANGSTGGWGGTASFCKPRRFKKIIIVELYALVLYFMDFCKAFMRLSIRNLLFSYTAAFVKKTCIFLWLIYAFFTGKA